ncbi:Hsp20/alpha crystallin family protein [Candidatus Bathyarchaeota archaeon]|nr:Hsp20/alpha crystallin family protein [Candidatus Bathyarchaeota archaeon]
MSLYKRRRGPEVDSADVAAVLIGIVAIAIVLALLVRLQRGLLGIILGSIAVILAVYWILDLRRTLRRELRIRLSETRGWNHDIIEDGAEILVVGRVPGPHEKIEVLVRDDLLEVKGSRHFRELIKLPAKASILGTVYNNGVLEIRLKK